MRRPLFLVLAPATLALAGFGCWFGLLHDPVSALSRSGQVAYASLLLVPPLLFMVLATPLAASRSRRIDVLGLLALAALVGTPALLYFLGIAGLALELVGLAALALAAWQERGRESHGAQRHPPPSTGDARSRC
ncbi:MAG: hypothetical protein ACXVZW_07595 [Gaiellaceae bacterium]